MKKNFGMGRSRKEFWENLHLLMAVAVIVLVGFAFFKSDQYEILFPIVFFVAAVMNFFNGMSKLAVNEKHKRSVKGAVFWFLCTIAFLVLAVVGIVSML